MAIMKTGFRLVLLLAAFGCNRSTYRSYTQTGNPSRANANDEAVMVTMSKNELARLQGALMYTGADFSAIMTWLNSQHTPCSLHSIIADQGLGNSEDKRLEALSRAIAEYTVLVKFSPRHVPLPGDSRIVREALAAQNSSTERRNGIINSLATVILGNINARLKEAAAKQHGGLTAEQKTEALIDLFFPAQSLKDNYMNWCPEDNDPLDRRSVIDSPLPDFVVPFTTEQLTQLVRGERVSVPRRYEDPGTGSKRYDLPGTTGLPAFPRRSGQANFEPGGIGL